MSDTASEHDWHAFVCVTCGTQFTPTERPPGRCPICEDDREYIHPVRGQQWTTLPDLRGHHHNLFEAVEPGVSRVVTEPSFGIGQQAYLIETPQGNFLWDLTAFLDESTVAEIARRGGIAGIAISHPHFYTTMVDWSRALGGVPVYLHESDREWVMRPDEAVKFWAGDTLSPLPGLTLIRTGGHFPGGTMLHWDTAGIPGAESDGVLFSGDIASVVADRRWVTFMYSYPNSVPLDAATVRRMADMIAGYRFARIHDAFDKHVVDDGSGAIARSADRYIAHVEGRAGPTI